MPWQVSGSSSTGIIAQTCGDKCPLCQRPCTLQHRHWVPDPTDDNLKPGPDWHEHLLKYEEYRYPGDPDCHKWVVLGNTWAQCGSTTRVFGLYDGESGAADPAERERERVARDGIYRRQTQQHSAAEMSKFAAAAEAAYYDYKGKGKGNYYDYDYKGKGQDSPIGTLPPPPPQMFFKCYFISVRMPLPTCQFCEVAKPS